MNSFFRRTIREWNSLPENIATLPNLDFLRTHYFQDCNPFCVLINWLIYFFPLWIYLFIFFFNDPRQESLFLKEVGFYRRRSSYYPFIFKTCPVDLFTDTVAILNLLALRSIMGCPGGTRSVFTRAFRAKRELQWIFFGKKATNITSKHGTTIFFLENKEKLVRKAHIITDASSCPLGIQ